MRPVNLIPPEERTGAAAASGRSGVAGYVIIAVLVVAIGVVAYVTKLGNDKDEKQSEINSLQAQVQDSQARATALAPYVQLQSIREARTVTIDSLAKSRFDWERVLRELARVTPSSISLSSVVGTVAPNVDVEGGTEVSLRSQVAGPALEIVGCSLSQRHLADFISALHDIDGVTRVAAQNSIKGDRPEQEEGAESDSNAPTEQSTGECARAEDANFGIVVAFDEVAVPAGATAVPDTTVTSTTAPTGADDGGVAAEQTSQAQQQQQIDNAKSKSQDAANLVPGG